METINTEKHSVHKVLAHSYVVYLIFFLLAIYLDAIFGFKVFPDTFMAPVGLFFLMLGFGVITNSFFVIVFSIISFLTAKFIFIEKQEKMLEEKYGTHYTEYKKSVKF